jgi:hypothetical protein
MRGFEQLSSSSSAEPVSKLNSGAKGTTKSPWWPQRDSHTGRQRADRPLPKMQALGACMNKLLLYAFAVMSRREAFQLDHDWQRTTARVA